MVAFRQSTLTVTNVIATVNERWQAVILRSDDVFNGHRKRIVP